MNKLVAKGTAPDSDEDLKHHSAALPGPARLWCVAVRYHTPQYAKKLRKVKRATGSAQPR